MCFRACVHSKLFGHPSWPYEAFWMPPYLYRREPRAVLEKGKALQHHSFMLPPAGRTNICSQRFSARRLRNRRPGA